MMKPNVIQPVRKVAKSGQKIEQPLTSLKNIPDDSQNALIRTFFLALLPLRFFMGVTFLYAGIQKLTDPGFLNPHGRTYIGLQLTAFARNSPLSGFLLHVAAPHAVIFGLIVAWGEVAIGIGALFGIVYRPAAFFGMLLSAILWLSASWTIKPYFYGADIFSLFAWTPLFIAGSGNLYVLDSLIARRVEPWFLKTLGNERGTALMGTLGLKVVPVQQYMPARNSKRGYAVQTQPSRRDFIRGMIAGAAAMLTGIGLWQLIRPAATTITTGTNASSAGTAAAVSTTTTSASSTVISNLNNLPVNSSAQFTIPSNQDPGIVVRLSQNSVVAFDATCTHNGCPVQYDSGSQVLYCPCHGAEFDPKNNAAVIQGPTNQPLAPVAIAVDQSNGNILLQ